ncbi:MAG TPA: DUF2750 domain-containing protein [Thermoanaerobaculia bacterium]|nr:DUF2750 domain-containing protein [Thermoanaerobaculia bacterium]
MTWEIEESEVRQLLALPAGDRTLPFFQLVADWEEAWGLRDEEGWVVAKDTDALPLWPHSTFAAACAQGAWEGTVPEPIPVDDLMVELLPLLEEDGLLVAVFPAPGDAGTVMSPREVLERLEAEIEIGNE